VLDRALMLEHLGELAAGQRLMEATKAVAASAAHTPVHVLSGPQHLPEAT
jgi:hypothetical protein